MKWFGAAYGASYERETEHVATPVGKACAWCGEHITATDDGVLMPRLDRLALELPYHYECNLRMIIGGLNHLHRKCTCCGGKLPPDPEDMTLRQAAIAAVNYYVEQRQK